MKILFFIESLRPGGKERRLVELLAGLKKHNSINYELVLTRSQIHYKKFYDLEIPLHIIERKYIQKDPRLFLQFYKIARSIKPDIIHVWGNMAAIYATPAKVILGIPMINNQIGDAPQDLSQNLLSHKLTFPFSDKIIANSKAGLLAYNPPRQKSEVIYNGFDFIRLNNLQNPDFIKKKFHLSSNIIIGMVAAFSRFKDYATYIKAALIVMEKVGNVMFFCVGSGDNIKYQKMVPSKFKQRIIFIEPQKDILSLINVCDIGVLATYTEGISNALMEFMALGKPTVATDGGGTKELVLDCVTGYLVKMKSEVELAERIFELLNNKTLRDDMGRKGRNRIQVNFEINKMVDLFKNEYEKLENN